MKCTFCGAEIEEDAVFCTSCGNAVTGAASGEDDVAEDMTVAFDADASAEAEDAPEEISDDINDGEEALTDETDVTDVTELSTDVESDVQGSAPEKKSPVDSGRMTLAVVLLSAALLAVIGFLFVDRLVALSASATRSSTIRIVSQSEDIQVKAGTPTKFFVDADGTNLTYQWYIKKSGDQMWHLWKNHDKSETSSTANESWDGMQVYCMVTDNNRTSVASEIITITIAK